MTYPCPVCGYDLHWPAYRANKEPSFKICPSCSFEFGYTDDALDYTHEQWRQKWIDGGMLWREGRSAPPEGWDPRKQLLNIGVKLEE